MHRSNEVRGQYACFEFVYAVGCAGSRRADSSVGTEDERELDGFRHSVSRSANERNLIQFRRPAWISRSADQRDFPGIWRLGASPQQAVSDESAVWFSSPAQFRIRQPVLRKYSRGALRL